MEECLLLLAARQNHRKSLCLALDSKHNRMHKMFDWRAFDTTWYGVVFSGHAEQIFESF